MKWYQFLGGMLIGCGLGLMAGAALVDVSGDGTRKYPVFLSMLLTLTGMVAVFGRRGLRARNDSSANAGDKAAP